VLTQHVRGYNRLVSITDRLLKLFGKIGLPRRGWATAIGFGTAGTRGPKPLEREQPPSDDRAER
jgi:hypothetical protein